MTRPRPSLPLLSLTLLATLAACTPPQRLAAPASASAAGPGPIDATHQAAVAACRTEVDRVYAAQNRESLSTRDERDSPFSANYLPGVTTAGLGARYGRDNMMSSCLANATGAASPSKLDTPATTGANPGRTFNPINR